MILTLFDLIDLKIGIIIQFINYSVKYRKNEGLHNLVRDTVWENSDFISEIEIIFPWVLTFLKPKSTTYQKKPQTIETCFSGRSVERLIRQRSMFLIRHIAMKWQHLKAAYISYYHLNGPYFTCKQENFLIKDN